MYNIYFITFLFSSTASIHHVSFAHSFLFCNTDNIVQQLHPTMYACNRSNLRQVRQTQNDQSLYHHIQYHRRRSRPRPRPRYRSTTGPTPLPPIHRLVPLSWCVLVRLWSLRARLLLKDLERVRKRRGRGRQPTKASGGCKRYRGGTRQR